MQMDLILAHRAMACAYSIAYNSGPVRISASAIRQVPKVIAPGSVTALDLCIDLRPFLKGNSELKLLIVQPPLQ